MSFKNYYRVRKRESESMATLASPSIHKVHSAKTETLSAKTQQKKKKKKKKKKTTTK
jgi:hypothetical protein